jgi:HAD superfamily hydrolase (TIGR01490 family)
VYSAAVFDLDNTLVRGSSLFHFARFLVRRRVIGARHVARFAIAQRRYLNGSGESEAATTRAVDRALGLVRGFSHAAMVELSEEFVAQRQPRHTVAGVLLEVMKQQARGVPCFIATASPQELADAYARRLHMAGAFGTVSEVVDGRYSGRLAGPVCHGPAKVRRVRAGLAERGLDLSHAIAYTDSVNDLPLLAAVGRPVAVNPDLDLIEIAERNAWAVIPGRRDDRRASQSMLANLPFPL